MHYISPYFIDKCLPFGASISCSHFQRLSNALRHIVQVLEQTFNSMTNYLDDFLFIHWIRSYCNKLMRSFIKVCDDINLPISPEKTEDASPKMIFLGMLLNGRLFTVMVPEEKRNKALHLLQKFCSKKKATVKEIEVLTGTLNFLKRAIVPGRVFTRRMYAKIEQKLHNKLGQSLKPFHHFSLDAEFRNDCQIWIKFLQHQTAVN